MLSVVGALCCNELFQQRKRRRQSTTSSITKLRYTTAKTFDEDVRRAWRQQSGSDGQVEDTEEGDGGAVWQSQSQSQRRQRGHDNCDCARCRCRPKPDNSSTSSVLYVTKPPLYWPHRTTHVADTFTYQPPCQLAIIAINCGCVNLAMKKMLIDLLTVQVFNRKYRGVVFCEYEKRQVHILRSCRTFHELQEIEATDLGQIVEMWKICGNLHWRPPLHV